MSGTKKIQVLFVCLGNICRSPCSEGLFRRLVAKEGLESSILVDSAGTGDYHIGSPPDTRAITAAAMRDVDISDLKARQVRMSDFSRFDYVIAMDDSNYSNLVRHATAEQQQSIHLFRDFTDHGGNRQIPDPYFGDESHFESVLDMIEEASMGLLRHIRTTHALGQVD